MAYFERKFMKKLMFLVLVGMFCINANAHNGSWVKTCEFAKIETKSGNAEECDALVIDNTDDYIAAIAICSSSEVPSYETPLIGSASASGTMTTTFTWTLHPSYPNEDPPSYSWFFYGYAGNGSLTSWNTARVSGWWDANAHGTVSGSASCVTQNYVELEADGVVTNHDGGANCDRDKWTRSGYTWETTGDWDNVEDMGEFDYGRRGYLGDGSGYLLSLDGEEKGLQITVGAYAQSLIIGSGGVGSQRSTGYAAVDIDWAISHTD